MPQSSHLQPPNYIVLDTETGVDNHDSGSVGKFRGNPFHPDNEIVSCGWKSKTLYSYNYKAPQSLYQNVLSTHHYDAEIIIGHNLRFDMHYIRKGAENHDPEMFNDYFCNRRIWDTQHVEYLLSGQLKQQPSLNYCIEKYGGTLKDDKIKAYWDADVRTQDIPEQELMDYMKNDVLMTEMVFLKQWEAVNKLKVMPFVESQMDFVLALQEMEYNGIKMDRELALEKAYEYRGELDQLNIEMSKFMTKHASFTDPNPGSGQQLSHLIFGGTWKETVKVPDLDDKGVHKHFKTGLKKGQLRFRNQVNNCSFKGLLDPGTRKRGKNGCYSMQEAEINKIRKTCKDRKLLKFLDLNYTHKARTKELNTYYIGYLLFTWEHNDIINPNLNNTRTRTGRLSSTQPNMQNLKKEDD